MPPCPVDCISMVPAATDWTQERANQARQNHYERQDRLARVHAESTGPAARTLANKAPVAAQAAHDPEQKQQAIADALARARQRRAAKTNTPPNDATQ